MSGCPYIKFDYKHECEVCRVTEMPTNGALTCDFDYEDCAAFKLQKRDAKKETTSAKSAEQIKLF